MASRDIHSLHVWKTHEMHILCLYLSSFRCLKLNSILQIVWMRLRGSLRSQIN